jgi:ribose transport system substrate-binding protein
VTAARLRLKVTKPSKSYNIAFVLGAIQGTYFAALTRGGKAAASALGLHLAIVGPPTYDAASQATVIDSELAKQPAAMVVEPVDAQLSIPPLQQVHNAGIPIITMDTVIGNGNYGQGGRADFPLSYVGSDNQAAGKASCLELAKEIHGNGQIFLQADLPGDSSLLARMKGCHQALAAYPKIKVVSTQYANEDAGKAQSQAAAVLERYPHLAGIFSGATAPSEGTAAAVSSAGKIGQVKLVAFDASKAELDWLERGAISAVIAQRPALMGKLGVEMAVAVLEGQKNLPTFVDTGTTVVTRKNLRAFKAEGGAY